MGVWRIGTDTLAQSRFAVSALAETIASLLALQGRGAVPGLPAHTPDRIAAYRQRLTADPALAVFFGTASKPRWIPDFMSRPPRPEDRTFHDELSRVRHTPVEVARADVATALGGPVPAALAVPDLPDRVADLLEWVWQHTVEPVWTGRRRIFEADIVSRTRQLSTGGWAAALSGMRPGMHWVGAGRLQVNTYENPARDLDDGELLFIPTTARRGWVAWDLPHRYAVVYPCTGLLAEPGRTDVPRALGALLGPVRAAVLDQLDTPRSTTQLVALGGYGLGTVGRHLKILLDAGLVARRRSGRSVLYYRTPTGEQLVRIQTGTDQRTDGPNRRVRAADPGFDATVVAVDAVGTGGTAPPTTRPPEGRLPARHQ